MHPTLNHLKHIAPCALQGVAALVPVRIAC